jgi:hypothetical protein
LREEDLLISVEKIKVTPKPNSKYGQIEPDGYIEITCFLQRIEIDVEENSGLDITAARVPYSWRWVGKQKSKKLPPEVYLDSPRSDIDSPADGFISIQGENGRMYCAPGRKEPDGNLICLLLQRLNEVNGIPVYRRVGLTVISSYQADQREIHKSWLSHFGKPQRIRLV